MSESCWARAYHGTKMKDVASTPVLQFIHQANKTNYLWVSWIYHHLPSTWWIVPLVCLLPPVSPPRILRRPRYMILWDFEREDAQQISITTFWVLPFPFSKSAKKLIWPSSFCINLPSFFAASNASNAASPTDLDKSIGCCCDCRDRFRNWSNRTSWSYIYEYYLWVF